MEFRIDFETLPTEGISYFTLPTEGISYFQKFFVKFHLNRNFSCEFWRVASFG